MKHPEAIILARDIGASKLCALAYASRKRRVLESQAYQKVNIHSPVMENSLPCAVWLKDLAV